jgi:Predicted nucleotide-binding protein containing TIR-like domain
LAKPVESSSIRIFFAWQSDLDKKFNKYALKKCLKAAGAELEEMLSLERGNSVEITIDEATRDLPGSPHIPTAILEKIQAADVFVADVSTINSDQLEESKKTPNPNVVFELGYAVAHLGWDRVLLLVNEVHGAVTSLPFDFDRQRATPFKLAANGVGSAAELTKTLKHHIALILKKNPTLPRAIHFNRAETERERDLTNLRWFLGSVHWPTIDNHVENTPKLLGQASTGLYEEVETILQSSTFHLYDEDLMKAVTKLATHWHNSVTSEYYEGRHGKSAYVFTHGHPSDRVKAEKNYNYLQNERVELGKAATALMKVIRAKFPEVDIAAVSEAAGKRYDADVEAVSKRFDRPKSRPILAASSPEAKSKDRAREHFQKPTTKTQKRKK